MVALRIASLLAVVAFVALTSAVHAQEAAQPVRSPLLTVDQERLFSGSRYGRALLAEIEAESTKLATENRGIEAELMAEERALTEERPRLDPEVFRQKAAAFDDKVVAIRAAQDEKARALARRREAAQGTFYREALPILTQITRERGAVAVLESRTVILAADQIDITDEAIARIDARLDFKEPAVQDSQD